MSERAGYSRLYWNLVDDPKFANVYDSDARFAAWVRMLMIADQAYPTSAHLPSNVRRAAVADLAEAGLVELLPGHRFRIHGLAAERERRKAMATSRGPSGDRPVPIRVSAPQESGPQGRGLGQDEDKNEDADTARDDDPADIYWQLTGKYPGDKALPWIDDLTSKYGVAPVVRALVKAHINDRSTSTLLGRTQDQLRSEARELDRREREAEQARLREKRATPRPEEPWRVEWRKAIEARYQGDAA